MINQQTVLLVNGIFEERIVARALLPHIQQERVGCAPIDIVADTNCG
jgi:hypothetical protein